MFRFTILLAVLVVLVGVGPVCALPDVITGPVDHRGSQYYLLDSSTWTDAEAKGVEMGGHLVSIYNLDESVWVWDTFGDFNTRWLWIGLNDTAEEGRFVWSSGAPVTFADWRRGEPTGFTPPEDYVFMLDRRGAWYDARDVSADSGRTLHGVVEISPHAWLPDVLAGPLTYDGHVYYLLENSTWTDAEAKAVRMGGHLVTVNDNQENVWIWDTFAAGSERKLWIGLNDLAREGTFVWSSGEQVAFTDWGSRDPTGTPGENFVTMERPGFWIDQHDVTNAFDAARSPYHGLVEVVPEPSTLTLTAIAVLGLLAWRWRRKRRVQIGLTMLLMFALSPAGAYADTFGTGGNQFSIHFVPLSGGTNPTSGYGIAADNYRMGVHEITNDQWDKFKAELGVAGVRLGLRD